MLALGTGTVTPASAATCTVTGITPASVTVGLSPVTRTWGVRTGGCTVEHWYVLIDRAYVIADSAAPTWAIDPAYLVNGDAGTSYADVTVLSDDGEDTEATAPFTLKRRATWGSTLNAGPEPVKKGKKITVLGTLGRADWTRNAYVGYSGQRVRVQFRAAKTTTWTTVKTVITGTSGKVSTTITASRDGAWRLYYGGNSVTAAATSKADYVDVR